MITTIVITTAMITAMSTGMIAVMTTVTVTSMIIVMNTAMLPVMITVMSIVISTFRTGAAQRDQASRTDALRASATSTLSQTERNVGRLSF